MDTPALLVRRKWSPNIRPFLPFEAEPLQVFHHRTREFQFGASGIKVFVAQYEHTVPFERAPLRRPKRASVTNVQVAAR